MTAILVILFVGAGDLVRGVRSQAVGGALAAALVVLLGGAAVLLAGAPWPGVLTAAVLAALWMVVMPLGERPRPAEPPLWPAPLLLAAVLVASLVDRSRPSGWLADALAASNLPGTPSQHLAALAVGLLLIRTANLVVRAALRIARTGGDGDQAADDSGAGRSWRVRLLGVPVGQVEPTATDAARGAPLLGGRMIGPLERLLVVALVLLGAEAIVVALLAAKGIVRFPEISADRGRGSKAEEFLIGSLMSWAIAVAGLAAIGLAA